jgi:hypothetical protein
MSQLLQLVSGVQDLYLIGNPQITFFKVRYHKKIKLTFVKILYKSTNQIRNISNLFDGKSTNHIF